MTFLLQQAWNGVVLGAVFTLFALGFSLVLANLRIFNVAHVSVFVWGAIGAYFTMVQAGAPFIVGLIIAILVGAAVNVGIYVVALRWHQDRRDGGLAGFVSSLGALIVLTQLAGIALNQATVRLPFDVFPIVVWRVGFVQVSSIQLVIAGLALVSCLVLWRLLEYTHAGRQIKAVAYDRELASLWGVRVDLTTGGVFALSGALAGVAATLMAVAFNVISADMGTTYGLTAIAITVVGGFGSVVGTFVAGIGIGLISSLTTAYFTTSYRDVVIFAILVGVLLLRPTGLLSSSSSAVSRK